MAEQKKRTLEEYLDRSPSSEAIEPKPIDVDVPYRGPTKGTTQAQSDFRRTTPLASGSSGYPPVSSENDLPLTSQKSQVSSIPRQTSHQLPSTPALAPTQTSAWERALVGATPLLVGLLTGNKMEGAQVASDYLTKSEGDLYKRERDFNDKLNEMAMKRIPAGKVSASTFNYMGSDGKPRLGRVVNGEFLYDELSDPLAVGKDTKPNWQKVERLNPETGRPEISFVNPNTLEERLVGEAYKAPRYQLTDIEFQGEPTKVAVRDGKIENYLGKTPKKAADNREQGINDRYRETKVLDALKQVTGKNSTYNTVKTDAENIVKAADLLNKPNPFSDEGVKTFMARSVFSEKGPLSDFDLARLAGSGAIDDTAVRNIQRWRDGQRITDADAIAMRNVLDAVYPYIRAKAMGDVEGIIAAYEAGGYDIRPRVDAYMKTAGFPDMPKWTNPRRDKVDAKKSVQSQMDMKQSIQPGHKEGGFTFQGGDPSNKANWKKD